ncbi:MAG: hypothetical protein UH071_09120 [Paludibacteraceae bacterium]|nr:hypothetical protein [Paludibacteraceae bacterium]
MNLKFLPFFFAALISTAANAETFDEVNTESLIANDASIYGNLQLYNNNTGLTINLPRAAENYSNFIECKNNNIAVYNRMFLVNHKGNVISTGVTVREQSADHCCSPSLGINYSDKIALSTSENVSGFSFSTNSYSGGPGEKYYPMVFKADQFIYDKGDMVVNGKITCKNELNVTAINTSSIKTDDINVNMSNVADYVFDENYDLKSLSEVERYVNEHKHLPGIPSATEIEQNGVSLSKMSNMLLEKVEELTLHLIRLEKENAELKAKFESLEK